MWKGDVLKYPAVTSAGRQYGINFTEGKEYIVYANRSNYVDNIYWAGICSGTAFLRDAQLDINALGEGNAPQAETGAPAAAQSEGTVAVVEQWIMILAVAAGVILVVGFAVFAGMRRR